MWFSIGISFRNLMRQKRRNLFLGVSIAFGVMILVVANSFSHGISDIMLNRIVRYVAGQVGVAFNEEGKMFQQICRDKERVMKVIHENAEGIVRMDESIGVFCRGVGNGRAESIVVAGLDVGAEVSSELKEEFESSFKIVEGNFEDLKNPDIENPAVLSIDKAEELNVRLNDVVRIRFRNVFGQEQAARLTVVGIMRISNIFMSGVVFTDIDDLKSLMGYKPWEMGNLNITVSDPAKNAIRIANRLHDALKPGLALIAGKLYFGKKSIDGSVLGFLNDENEREAFFKEMEILDGDVKEMKGKKGVVVTKALASSIGLRIGDCLGLRYVSKFENKVVSKEFWVNGIVNWPGHDGERVLFLNEYLFYDLYYPDLPIACDPDSRFFVPGEGESVFPFLSKEWVLLDRSESTDEYKKKISDIGKKRWRATVVDVTTMYESASDVLKLENALNLITLIAVFILFFIILIGVLNTLRISIRERTREIGTMRAIGMQREDVRNCFILETLFLSLFASLVGVGMGFLLMWCLSKLSLNMQDNPLAMLLVDGHLYFLPSFGSIVLCVCFILGMAVVTAFFPARKASGLSVAEALRHYE